jgi:hypothetical protein
MQKTQARLVSFTSRALAVGLMMGGALWMQAQTVQSAAPASSQASSLNLTLPSMNTSDDSLFSSSSSSTGDLSATQVAAVEPIFSMPALNAMQYGGGRRRYGRPRYRGGNTNADGSPKYDFFIGGGFGMPVGSQFNYATTSWGVGGGGGRMFNAHVGVNLEFNYDEFGMTGATLNNQENLYNYYINNFNTYCSANPSDPNCANGAASPIAGLDGNNHVWSFTLDPIYNIRSGEGIGAYVTGGGGFYHKVANFTVPSVGEYCDPYYGCYEYEANQTIDHYTSNAFGVNGGFGLTYKFSRFANERLYAEVRYVYIFNQFKPGVTVDTASAANADVANDFPYNSQRTSYVPVKFGLRF